MAADGHPAGTASGHVFDLATAVDGGPERWSAEVDPGWTVAGRPNGGYLLALLWSQVRERSRLLAALGGAAIALVLMPFTGPGIPIVAASLACLIGVRKPA